MTYRIHRGFQCFVLASAGCLFAMVASAAQTRLEILRPNQTSFEFRWLGSSAGMSLETVDALSAPTNWQAVAQTPQLLNGKYSVTLPAETGARFFRLRSTVIPLTTIESISPTNGETEVSVSRQIIVRLTGPLSGDAVSSDGIYAEQGGVRLDTTIELSEDRRTVTLSFLSNLPSLARVNVVVDGFILRDTNDRMVDANANGVPGGIRAVTFRTFGVTVPDDDGDGIDNVSEIALGTNPALWDTDGDGFGDGSEVLAEYDPLSANSGPGIRLDEAPGTNGELMSTLAAYGPFPVAPDAVTAEGLVLTRIAAVLNPNATPATVNAAMDAAGVRIVSMRPGLPFVTLALPVKAGAPYEPAEIQAIAGQLVQNSDLTPFLFANLTFLSGTSIAPGGPNSQASADLHAHDRIRMPAAWNLRGAPKPATPVKVLLPDYYYDLSGLLQLPNQRFVAAVSNRTPRFGTISRDFRGNHGYAVASALAGMFDELEHLHN